MPGFDPGGDPARTCGWSTVPSRFALRYGSPGRRSTGSSEWFLSARPPLQYMNDNILYHALARHRATRPEPPFRRYNAGGVESQAQCPPRPAGVSGRRPGAGGPGGEEAGFWLRAARVEQDNQALRQERDGLIERIKERIAGIYRELQALPSLDILAVLKDDDSYGAHSGCMPG